MSPIEADEHSLPSYFIKFEDGVTLPAKLKDGARRPKFQFYTDEEVEAIKPWSGPILCDMESGLISSSDGEYVLEYAEDLTEGREVRCRYHFCNRNDYVFIDIDHCFYTKEREPNGGYKPADRVALNSVRFRDRKIQKIESETASVIASLVCALGLFKGQRLRQKNPDCEIVLFDSFTDVFISLRKKPFPNAK